MIFFIFNLLTNILLQIVCKLQNPDQKKIIKNSNQILSIFAKFIYFYCEKKKQKTIIIYLYTKDMFSKIIGFDLSM